MLKKQYRGLLSSDIRKIFKGSKSLGSVFFRISWVDSDTSCSQFVVITSRKFHHSAVVRNKFRRFVYSVLERHYSDWTVGLRVAILVKNSSLRLPFKDLEKILLQQFRKAGLIHN